MTAVKTGLLSAILAVQSEAPTLPKNATNPHFKSKFCPLDTIVETIGPLLAKNELVWTTLPGVNEHGQPALTYQLHHAPTGDKLEGTMPLLLSKADAQGQGSAITYARRYAICAVLNLVADDDDDGQRAATASSRQAGQRDATSPQKSGIKRRIKQQGVSEHEARQLLKGAGVQLADDAKVNAAIDGLSFEQASAILDMFTEGAIPTGGSDVPSDASGFTHPPEPDPLPES